MAALAESSNSFISQSALRMGNPIQECENNHTLPHNGNSDTIQIENSENEDDEPSLDIVISNVVCTFSVRCHLNLREIALISSNVEYKREQGMLTMKIRNPYTTASIWSSGKITCTGATSEDNAKVAARKYARILQNLGYRVRFNNYRVVNVLGTCSLPFAVKLIPFSIENRDRVSYEPELHPGATYKITEPKATLKVFSTGSVTVTAPCVLNVQLAIEHIFPICYNFRRELADISVDERATILKRAQRKKAPYAKRLRTAYPTESDESDEDGLLDDGCESEESWE